MSMDQETLQQKTALYCRTRDIGLRNELVEAYMYLADVVAKKYAGRGVEFEDLRQVALVALIGALERFSCEKGIKFTTFAVPSMTGVVKNYFRDRARAVRMPRSIGERLRKITLAREELTQELQRKPGIEELAQRCGCSVEDVLEAVEASQSLSMASLDMQAGEEEDTPLWALIGSEDEEIEKVALRDLMSRVIETFSETERRILYMRYEQERTQRDIAEELGVSQMFISRLERKMLSRFREALSAA